MDGFGCMQIKSSADQRYALGNRVFKRKRYKLLFAVREMFESRKKLFLIAC
jgi:hypothetical protein